MTRSLSHGIVSAFVWIAAFCLASGVFLSTTLLLVRLPPTDPVAIGLVTIERYSKLRDYVGAALFFVMVPPLTIWLQRVFTRTVSRLKTVPERFLFTAPYVLSPFFYLTTGKVGWILILPVALSLTAPRVFAFTRARRWIREVFRPELGAWHALLFAEALAWLFYRYLVTGRRLAHIPTLFLETIFLAMFLLVFWGVTILIARLTELTFGSPMEDVFRRCIAAALPLVLLPFVAVAVVPLPEPRLLMAATLLLIAAIAFRLRTPMDEQSAWKLAAYAVFPALIYLFSYASTARLSQWVDLFHRGESIGPASDYLRGKVPFRDTFPLHGMLEDGVLDAWLMQIFERSLDVAILRSVVIGALLGVAIWYLGLAVFRSIPLALLCVAVGSWTTAENNRTFFQVAAVALFWNALQRRSRVSAVAAGVVAGVALFFSYEIGLYTIAGALAASFLIWIVSRRVEWSGMHPAQATALFLTGSAVGAAPFALYLASHGALDDFITTSFVVTPRIIDAVWSLPFPDIVSTFRRDLNLHTLADFILWEKFHLIVSPLTIAIAAIYYIQRWLARRTDVLDHALLVMIVFATVAQRTAFGRASFRHQYFAAFLIGPLLVMLAYLVARMLGNIWRRGDDGSRAFVVTLVAAVVPVVTVLFWIPDLVNARLNDFITYYPRHFAYARDAQAEAVRWRITDVTNAIQALTTRDEPIFDFSNQPAFYFFADRPNPTRFYQVPILSPKEFQAETIRVLEKERPKVIIRRSPELFDQFDGVTNELRAQAVAAYIDDTYSFHRAVRGVELWTRRSDSKTRDVEDYLALIRLPDRKELVSGRLARMVFPAVGSSAGMAGSYWQSDLTMHNPFRDPLRVRLRMVADRTVERAVTLAPQQTMRWSDVVRTFFGIHGRVGTLWVEHREGRAPVAVVKTSDVAHGAQASIEEPLTVRDAATASTENAELAIVGFPPASAGVRRVNVGMINIGIVPARFRVTARTRSGVPVGGILESGVTEDEVWVVNNVEQALGITLDETMSLRIMVLAGTGVAYATVVHQDGDSEFIAAIPAQQQ